MYVFSCWHTVVKLQIFQSINRNFRLALCMGAKYKYRAGNRKARRRLDIKDWRFDLPYIVLRQCHNH